MSQLIKKKQEDQAAGLRSMMSGPKPHIFSIIAASSMNTSKIQTDVQSRLLANIAASLNKSGAEVLIAQAAKYSNEHMRNKETMPSMMEEISNGIVSDVEDYDIRDCILNDAKHGFSVTRLFPKNKDMHQYKSEELFKLSHLFKRISNQYDIVLVDVDLNKENTLPIEFLSKSHLVIQTNRSPSSVKDAYSLIKVLSMMVSDVKVNILVTDANQLQAQQVFKTISETASKFIKVELIYFGNIPADESISLAAKLGRSVIEHFPSSIATQSFHVIASKLHHLSVNFQNYKTANPSMDLNYKV